MPFNDCIDASMLYHHLLMMTVALGCSSRFYRSTHHHVDFQNLLLLHGKTEEVFVCFKEEDVSFLFVLAPFIKSDFELRFVGLCHLTLFLGKVTFPWYLDLVYSAFRAFILIRNVIRVVHLLLFCVSSNIIINQRSQRFKSFSCQLLITIFVTFRPNGEQLCVYCMISNIFKAFEIRKSWDY